VEEEVNWISFKSVMESALGDPENRIRSTWYKYYTAKQGSKQSVASYESYLRGLIDELGIDNVGSEEA
jgi:hypothetical protein